MEGNGSPARITVSEDKLDAKLTRLELNLVDRITAALESKADQAYVEQLHARLHTLEGSVQATALLLPSLRKTADDVETRIRGLERFRFAMPSASFVSAVAAIGAVVFTFIH